VRLETRAPSWIFDHELLDTACRVLFDIIGKAKVCDEQIPNSKIREAFGDRQ
jgi:hypothetical protein